MPGFLPAAAGNEGYQQMPPHDLTPEPQLDMQWGQWRDDGSLPVLDNSHITPHDFTTGSHQYSGTEEDDLNDGLALATPFDLDFSFPLT